MNVGPLPKMKMVCPLFWNVGSGLQGQMAHVDAKLSWMTSTPKKLLRHQGFAGRECLPPPPTSSEEIDSIYLTLAFYEKPSVDLLIFKFPDPLSCFAAEIFQKQLFIWRNCKVASQWGPLYCWSSNSSTHYSLEAGPGKLTKAKQPFSATVSHAIGLLFVHREGWKAVCLTNFLGKVFQLGLPTHVFVLMVFVAAPF